jgi:hypothetical protein
MNFLETRLVGPTDITFSRSSATKNGLTSNNRFRFQGKVVKVSSV